MKTAAWLVAALAGGYFVAVVTGLLGDDQGDGSDLTLGGSGTLTNTAIEGRILVLETQLAEEKKERQRIESLLDELLDGRWLGDGQNTADGETETSDRESNNVANLSPLSPAERRQQSRDRALQRQENLAERRIQRLESAGFPPDQVAWILLREEQIRLDNLNAQWERRRQNFLNSEENQLASNPLREELGEANYERYLAATGRSTSVYVSQLVNNSQASAAGFQPGDEIVRYSGERVYNFDELNAANVQGSLGEPVVVDIVRDGVPMQLTVARGPLGITGGRRRGFRGP